MNKTYLLSLLALVIATGCKESSSSNDGGNNGGDNGNGGGGIPEIEYPYLAIEPCSEDEFLTEYSQLTLPVGVVSGVKAVDYRDADSTGNNVTYYFDQKLKENVTVWETDGDEIQLLNLTSDRNCQLYKTQKAGDTVISATFYHFTDSFQVQIEDLGQPVAYAIKVKNKEGEWVEDNFEIIKNGAIQLDAWASYANTGAELRVTSDLVWKTEDASIAETEQQHGLIKGAGQGITRVNIVQIIDEQEEILGSVEVNVLPTGDLDPFYLKQTRPEVAIGFVTPPIEVSGSDYYNGYFDYSFESNSGAHFEFKNLIRGTEVGYFNYIATGWSDNGLPTNGIELKGAVFVNDESLINIKLCTGGGEQVTCYDNTSPNFTPNSKQFNLAVVGVFTNGFIMPLMIDRNNLESNWSGDGDDFKADGFFYDFDVNSENNTIGPPTFSVTHGEVTTIIKIDIPDVSLDEQ